MTRASTFLTTRSFAGRSADVPSERTHRELTVIPVIADPVETSISIDIMIAITAGRIQALSDLVNAREPNEERAFARTTLREVWRPVFNVAFREHLGQHASLKEQP